MPSTQVRLFARPLKCELPKRLRFSGACLTRPPQTDPMRPARSQEVGSHFLYIGRRGSKLGGIWIAWQHQSCWHLVGRVWRGRADCAMGMDRRRQEQIRDILNESGRLAVPVESLDVNSDLFAAGLDSVAIVDVLLRLEERFDIELPEDMLHRRSFSSISALEGVVCRLTDERPQS